MIYDIADSVERHKDFKLRRFSSRMEEIKANKPK